MMWMTEEWGVCLFDGVVVVAHSAAYGLLQSQCMDSVEVVMKEGRENCPLNLCTLAALMAVEVGEESPDSECSGTSQEGEEVMNQKVLSHFVIHNQDTQALFFPSHFALCHLLAHGMGIPQG